MIWAIISALSFKFPQINSRPIPALFHAKKHDITGLIIGELDVNKQSTISPAGILRFSRL